MPRGSIFLFRKKKRPPSGRCDNRGFPHAARFPTEGRKTENPVLGMGPRLFWQAGPFCAGEPAAGRERARFPGKIRRNSGKFLGGSLAKKGGTWYHKKTDAPFWRRGKEKRDEKESTLLSAQRREGLHRLKGPCGAKRRKFPLERPAGEAGENPAA